MKKYFYPLIFVALFIYSCTENIDKGATVNNQDTSKYTNKFHDQNILNIYEYSDHRQVDSLIPYLSNDNPLYRAEATLAFASISIDNYNLQTILPTLSDSSNNVRLAGAWSIGQSRENEAYEILKIALKNENNQDVRDNIWEAMGKTASEIDVNGLEELTILPGDSLGYSLCAYQLVLQNIQTEKILERLIGFVRSSDRKTRFFASHAFARNRKITIEDHDKTLLSALANEEDNDCKLSLISALRQTQSSESTLYLEKLLSEASEDYLVLINTLRSYSNREKIESSLIRKFLVEENEDLALTAANVLKKADLSEKEELDLYSSINNFTPSIRAEIAGMLLKSSENKEYADYLKYEISNTIDSYEIANYLRALANDKREVSFLSFKMLSEKEAAISTAAIEALIQIREEDWPQKEDFNELLVRGFSTGDVTIIGTLAAHLRNEEFDYKTNLTDISFIVQARKKLELPKEIETYNELLKTEAFLNGTEADIPSPEWNHPIDWEKVKTISKKQQLKVNTSSGSFVIEMQVENSPGSVVNFIQLAEEGYFDNKFFHRVVPNFVIQTGCPRGDGWGSVPYSIRSEFALHNYKTGAVGMASAGPDTESCQWFVCHSPTPHLEGRYTIFAYVVDGMESVHKIQVGTKIISVESI